MNYQLQLLSLSQNLIKNNQNRRSMVQFLRQLNNDSTRSIFFVLHFANDDTDCPIMPLRKFSRGEFTDFFNMKQYPICILKKGKLKQMSTNNIIMSHIILNKQIQYICEEQSLLVQLNGKQSQQYLFQRNLFYQKSFLLASNLLNCSLKSQSKDKIIDWIILQKDQFITLKQHKQNYIYILLQGKISITRECQINRIKEEVQLKINASDKYYLLGCERLFANKYYFTSKTISNNCFFLRIKVDQLQKLLSWSDYQKIKYQYNKRYQKVRIFLQRSSEPQEQSRRTIERFATRNTDQTELKKVSQICSKFKKIRQKFSVIEQNSLTPKTKDLQKDYLNYFFNENLQKLHFQLIKKGLKSVNRQNICPTQLNQKNSKQMLRIRIINTVKHLQPYQNNLDYTTPIKNKMKIRKKDFRMK